jgi:hypothetical protein
MLFFILLFNNFIFYQKGVIVAEVYTWILEEQVSDPGRITAFLFPSQLSPAGYWDEPWLPHSKSFRFTTHIHISISFEVILV